MLGRKYGTIVAICVGFLTSAVTANPHWLGTTISTTSGISVNRLSPIEIKLDWDSNVKANILREVGPKAEMIDAQNGFSEREIEFWVYSDGTGKNTKRVTQNDVKKQAGLYIYALQKINSELNNADVIRNNTKNIQTVAMQASLSNSDIHEIQFKAAIDHLHEKDSASYGKVGAETLKLLADFLIRRNDDARRGIWKRHKELITHENYEAVALASLALRALNDAKILKGINKINDFYSQPKNFEIEMPIDDL